MEQSNCFLIAYLLCSFDISDKMNYYTLRSKLCAFILVVFCLSQIEAQVRLCYSCHSRGKLGDCRDPFLFNATSLVPGVTAVPCASGWCSKTIDGDEYGEDHDLATTRECMQRSPPDLKPRCTEAAYHHKKIFICFCHGSLCNSSSQIQLSLFGLLTSACVYLSSKLLHSL